MTEQSIINKTICKVAYKTKPVFSFISIGIISIVASIYFFITPLPPLPDLFSRFGINKISIIIVYFILGIICILTPVIEWRPPIDNIIRKFFKLGGIYGILIILTICLFFVICIIDLIFGIMAGSVGFSLLTYICFKISSILDACPKLKGV